MRVGGPQRVDVGVPPDSRSLPQRLARPVPVADREGDRVPHRDDHQRGGTRGAGGALLFEGVAKPGDVLAPVDDRRGAQRPRELLVHAGDVVVAHPFAQLGGEVAAPLAEQGARPAHRPPGALVAEPGELREVVQLADVVGLPDAGGHVPAEQCRAREQGADDEHRRRRAVVPLGEPGPQGGGPAGRCGGLVRFSVHFHVHGSGCGGSDILPPAGARAEPDRTNANAPVPATGPGTWPSGRP